MKGNCWIFVVVMLSASCLSLRAEKDDDEEERGLVNLNLKINRPNFTRHLDEGRARMKNPFFFNLDIPNIFSMNLDTKKNDGTSLGLRVLNPINRFLGIFGIEPNKKTTEEGWALSKRKGKDEEYEEYEEKEEADVEKEKPKEFLRSVKKEP